MTAGHWLEEWLDQEPTVPDVTIAVEPAYMQAVTRFSTPEEHRRRLADAGIRALEQLQACWPDCPLEIENELTFMEMHLRQIRGVMP